MTRLYSYVLRFDDGAAPNPFWGICTLTICKPVIRRNARIGDWVIGTGSKNSKIKDGYTYDLSGSIVYAMKITDKLSLAAYDKLCNQDLQDKIPKWSDEDWRKRMGDCIYNFHGVDKPTMRKGVHNESNRVKDLSGNNALLSNHFYYFGEKPHPLPNHLKPIIKKNRGHLKIEQSDLINKFEELINQFDRNTIYAEPQLKHKFDRKSADKHISKCSTKNEAIGECGKTTY